MRSQLRYRPKCCGGVTAAKIIGLYGSFVKCFYRLMLYSTGVSAGISSSSGWLSNSFTSATVPE